MMKKIAASKMKGMSFLEMYLILWVVLYIGAGIIMGKVAPNLARTLDGVAIYVGDAPVVSIPIAVCLFFMIYPIMVKIEFGEVIQVDRRAAPATVVGVLIEVPVMLMLVPVRCREMQLINTSPIRCFNH